MNRCVNRWLPGLALLACAAIGAWLIVHTRFPAPDELEHVSTVAALQESGRWLPRYDTQTSLDVQDWMRWSGQRNYIGHPPPYYLYLGAVLDRSQPPQAAVIPLRAASFVLILFGVAAALARGFAVFRADRLALAVFCTGVALCPELLSVGRQVNNDALGFLGGALAYAAIVPRERRVWLDMGAGAGLMLALWAKPNAGLEAGLLLVGVMGLRRAAPLWLAATLGLGGLLGLVPYAAILLAYGKIVPVAAEDLFAVPRLQGWGEYVPAFLANVGATWGFMRVPVWPVTGVALGMMAAFWGMLAAIPLATRWRTGDGAVVGAALLAFAVVLAVHLVFSGTRLHFSLGAPSFRYYLPLWPALLHGVAAAVRDRGFGRRHLPTHPLPLPEGGRGEVARFTLVALAFLAFVLGWLP